MGKVVGRLSPKRAAECWIRFMEDRNERDRAALIEHYMPEVETIIRHFSNVRPQDREDLRSVGYLGLIKSVDKWDPSRMEWLRYLHWNIKFAMVDHIRAVTWVPKGIRATALKIEAAEEALAVQKGRAATPDELAEHLGVTVDELEQQVASFRSTDWVVASLDYRTESETPWTESVVDPYAEDPSAAVQRYEEMDTLELILARLPGRDRQVIRWAYFQWPRVPQKQIAEWLGVHESRVSQILAQALERAKKLRYQPCLLADEVFSGDQRFMRRE